MSNILQACMITLFAFPALGLAQVELMVAPTNVTIHVAEPVSFEVAARNRRNAPVSGFFLLSGRYDGFSIEVRKMGDTKSQRFVNAVMWRTTHTKLMRKLQSGNIVILPQEVRIFMKKEKTSPQWRRTSQPKNPEKIRRGRNGTSKR